MYLDDDSILTILKKIRFQSFTILFYKTLQVYSGSTNYSFETCVVKVAHVNSHSNCAITCMKYLKYEKEDTHLEHYRCCLDAPPHGFSWCLVAGCQYLFQRKLKNNVKR